MKRRSTLFLVVIFLAPVLLAQQAPDWATREYAAPADRVFAAALRSIQQQKHEIKTVDNQRMQVVFHVGMTAWSWGYNMMLNVDAVDATHSKVVVAVQSKSGGNAFSWGSGKKEVRKILGGIDAEIASGKTSVKD